MGFYLDPKGHYYEGDQLPGGVSVPQRPSAFHGWIDGAWLLDLEAMRADAIAQVDRQAGQQRSRYITVAPGQDMTYQEKVRQAQALQAYMTQAQAAADAATAAATAAAQAAVPPQEPPPPVQPTPPDPSLYPLIFGEVGITAADAAGVAVAVLAAYGQWQQIGAAIEKQRLTAKKAISSANDEAAVAAAMAAIVWP